MQVNAVVDIVGCVGGVQTLLDGAAGVFLAVNVAHDWGMVFLVTALGVLGLDISSLC